MTTFTFIIYILIPLLILNSFLVVLIPRNIGRRFLSNLNSRVNEIDILNYMGKPYKEVVLDKQISGENLWVSSKGTVHKINNSAGKACKYFIFKTKKTFYVKTGARNVIGQYIIVSIIFVGLLGLLLLPVLIFVGIKSFIKHKTVLIFIGEKGHYVSSFIIHGDDYQIKKLN